MVHSDRPKHAYLNPMPDSRIRFVENMCFENRVCTGSGRRTSALKIFKISSGLGPPLGIINNKSYLTTGSREARPVTSKMKAHREFVFYDNRIKKGESHDTLKLRSSEKKSM